MVMSLQSSLLLPVLSLLLAVIMVLLCIGYASGVFGNVVAISIGLATGNAITAVAFTAFYYGLFARTQQSHPAADDDWEIPPFADTYSQPADHAARDSDHGAALDPDHGAAPPDVPAWSPNGFVRHRNAKGKLGKLHVKASSKESKDALCNATHITPASQFDRDWTVLPFDCFTMRELVELKAKELLCRNQACHFHFTNVVKVP
jgi:hypothetical protein